MKHLGYPATWRTRCFIREGCATQVFAHTNGFGDFVLFDHLGQPWPVPECYQNRFVHRAESGFGITETNSFDLDGPPPPSWQFVVEIDPEKTGAQRVFNVVGTITELVPGAARALLDHEAANSDTLKQFRGVLTGRNDRARIVTGEGEVFSAFLSLKEHQVEFRDIVAATIKKKDVLGQKIFVVSKIQVWHVS
jgi:hypothetical protein